MCRVDVEFREGKPHMQDELLFGEGTLNELEEGSS